MTFKFNNIGIFVSILMISLDNIETPKIRQTNYIYRDLHLDIEPNIIHSSGAKISSSIDESENYNDIRIAVNEEAIKNSLVNLFNTFPGQKLLNPSYGLNLTQYLFTPATQEIAQQIGDTILRGITKYEPRVNVNNVSVGVNKEQQEYEISLSISIPKLTNAPVNLSGILTESNFTFK